MAPHRPPPESKAVSEDDSNRTFRTRLVLFWMLCNAVISVGIGHIAGLNPDEETLRTRQSMYFQFILVATFLCVHPFKADLHIREDFYTC